MQQGTLDGLRKVCNGLTQVAGWVREDTNQVVATRNHIDVIKHYNDVRLAAAQIKEAREALNNIEEQLSRETVPDLMRENKVKTITIEGVGRVTVSHRYSCSMLDKVEGVKWLKNNGHEGIVQETVNAQTLAAFAKNLLETEGKELPEEIFKVGTSPYTSITKVK